MFANFDGEWEYVNNFIDIIEVVLEWVKVEILRPERIICLTWLLSNRMTIFKPFYGYNVLSLAM